MGNNEELALAMRELNRDLANGVIDHTEFASLALEARREHKGVFELPDERHLVPEANAWVPSKRAAVLGKGLGQDFAICPDTGQVIALNAAAAARIRVKPGKSGSGQTGKRFPCGAAFVIGYRKNGNFVNLLMQLGAASSDPYTKASRVANQIEAKGGIAIYGYRLAGYELYTGDGELWDRYKNPEPSSLVLMPSRDRLVGKRQVVGVNGPKGLVLQRGGSHQPLSPMQIVVWVAWLKACKQDLAVKRITRMLRPSKQTKESRELSLKAATAMAGGVPFQERDYIEHWTRGTVFRLDPNTCQKVKRGVRVPIGCSAIDCSLPVNSDGHPFTLFWQDGSKSVDWSDANPTDPEECMTHALVLAEWVAGSCGVQHVRWEDDAGYHTVSRADAVLARKAADDSQLQQIRDNFEPRDRYGNPCSAAAHDGYVADLVACLDPFSDSFQDHRNDRWAEAQEAVVRESRALGETSRDEQEEEYQKHALALAEAEAAKRKVMREEIPQYERPGTINTPGPRQNAPHKWPGRAKNSPKGRTWDKRASAQRLNPNWRKNQG